MVSLHGYDRFVPICWYGSSPYNIPEVTTRKNLYGVSGIPDAWFDGIVRELGGISGGNMFSYYNPIVNGRLAVSSPLTMDAEWKLTTATAGTLLVDISVASAVTTTNNLVHFTIVEEGLTTYGITPGMARDMLTDESFTLNTPGQSVHYAKPFTLSPSWNVNNVGFVVFVQSHGATKDVLQAVRAQPGDRMVVTPETDFVATGPQGGPFTPESATYLVENRAATPIDYTVASTAPWLDIVNGSGTLPGNTSTEVVVELNSLAPALGAGLHDAVVTFTNATNGLGTTTRTVMLEVGERVRVFNYPLNGNPSWTSNALWAWGQPTGQGGQNGYPDPTSGHTGDNCYAYNLNGDYENNLAEKYLTLPRLTFTDYSGVQLRFWRWLGVGASPDHAYIRVSTNGVNWTDVWANPGAVTDNAWVQQVVDLSSIADGQGVFVRFVMGATDASGQYCGWNIDDIEFWGIANTQSSVPGGEAGSRLTLLPSRPNPFRDSATIAFELPATDVVRVAVYDVSGRLIREVTNSVFEAGINTVRWDGTDTTGRPVSSGVYFCRAEAGGVFATQRLVVLR